jgi:hypothetical protein
MTHAYYEPIKNKIYLSKWEVGSTTKYLHLATDGEFTGSWYFTNPKYLFYYLGEI